MPVEFLTDDEAAVFGRYAGPPARAELDQMFYLDDEDLRLISKRRGDHMRLGFSLQLTTVRYLGTFLVNPVDVPSLLTEHLARQLGIGDPSCVARYAERPNTPREHREEIKASGGLREFSEAEEDSRGGCMRGHGTPATGRRPIFTDGVKWLRENAVLLPGRHRQEPAQAHLVPGRARRRVPRPDRTGPRNRTRRSSQALVFQPL
jgi:hypothetical protein